MPELPTINQDESEKSPEQSVDSLLDKLQASLNNLSFALMDDEKQGVEGICHDIVHELEEIFEQVRQLNLEQLERLFQEIYGAYTNGNFSFEYDVWDNILFSNLDTLYDVVSQQTEYPSLFMRILRLRHPDDAKHEKYLEHSEEIEAKFGALFAHHYYLNKDKFGDIRHNRFVCDIAFYLDHCGQDIVDDFIPKLKSIFYHYYQSRHDEESPPTLRDLVEPGLLGALANTDNDVINEMIADFLGWFDLNWDTLKKSYRSTSKRKGQSSYVAKNIDAIDHLEFLEPGICSTLNQEFGIEFFGRYDSKTLIEQFKKRNEQLPYGVAIYPKSDWNGAFYQNKTAISSLRSGLSRKPFQSSLDEEQFVSKEYRVAGQDEVAIQLRIIEASGKFGVAKRLLALDRRYGGENKISFAIIGGHGTPDSIQFGEIRADIDYWAIYEPDYSQEPGTKGAWEINRMKAHTLLVEDLDGKGVSRTGTFFVNHPTIVLSSCSTGAKGGIAQKMASVLHAKLIAPDIPTNILTMSPIFLEDGGIDLGVIYNENNSKAQFVGWKTDPQNQIDPPPSTS